MNFAVAGSRFLITGAAMGMGRLYAERAVAEGASVVVLWDVNKKALDQTAREIAATAPAGVVIDGVVVDLSKREAIEKAAATVIATHGGVDVLINNAGVVRGGVFWEHDNAAHTEATMMVNAVAPMVTTHEFLPGMMSSGRECRIVNIASAAGLISNPKMSVYAASKWALIGWGDSVRLELKREGHGNVKLTTVAPTYISTGMFDGARGPLMTPLMKPDYVVGRVWKAMRSGKPMLMLPWTVHLSKFLKGVLPQRAFDVIADKVFHVYSSMDNFRGR
jgi:all-trans-retinol dehydrogenase (NAD+)